MTRSPDSLIPSDAEQSAAEKRDDKVSTCRLGGNANLRAAAEVSAISASTTPPAIKPIQLELFLLPFGLFRSSNVLSFGGHGISPKPFESGLTSA
jgi:hypothetical protein